MCAGGFDLPRPKRGKGPTAQAMSVASRPMVEMTAKDRASKEMAPANLPFGRI
jgi:hypothetical protein